MLTKSKSDFWTYATRHAGRAGWINARPIRTKQVVTSLGHQVGRRVFWEGPTFFKLSNTFVQGGEKNFVGGLCPSWLRAWEKVVTAMPPKRLAHVRSSFLCLQRQIAKPASGLLHSWSLLHNNNTATNLQMFTSNNGSRRFSACDQGSHWFFFCPDLFC